MRQSQIQMVVGDSLSRVADEYLDYCRTRNLSPNTLIYYRNGIKKLLDFCGPRVGDGGIESISASDVRAYLTHMMDSGYANKTINHAITVIRTFFAFLVDEGVLSASPADRLKRVKMARTLIETFSTDDILRMLEQCDMSKYVGIRNYTIILCLLDTGLRASELCGLRMSDIDRRGGFLRVMGKGNKERMVPFGASLGRILQDYLERRGEIPGEDHVFLTHYGEPINRYVLRVIIGRIGEQAGVAGVRVSPHTFRHTFAKNWIMNGGDPFSLQRILGHTTQQMVSQYVNLATGDLHAQHAKFSPVDNLPVTRQVKRRRSVVLK